MISITLQEFAVKMWNLGAVTAPMADMSSNDCVDVEYIDCTGKCVGCVRNYNDGVTVYLVEETMCCPAN